MTNQETKNWYETILDSQKKMTETLNETTKKFQANPAIETGSDFFKKMFDFQMDFVKNSAQTSSTKNAEEAIKENFEKWKGFYENLAKSQMEAINKSFSQNNNLFSQWTNNNPFASMNSNPFASMNFNNMPNMDMFTNMNKSFTDMYQNMMSNFNGSGTAKDVFGGLMNHTQSFMKFYEMWSPIQKAMQNGGFNSDMISKMIKPEAYKEFMDSFFGFMPAEMKGMFETNMNKMNEGMQSFSTQGMDMYKNMGSQWQQFIPQGHNMFSEAMNNYNNMYSQMQNAVAPFAKLITPTSDSKNTEAVSNIFDMMNKYQILNSQMKFMTYTTGVKAMDKMGINIAEKLKSGAKYNNMQDLFKEWLSTSDSFFIELFETDEFSKVQAESSALALRIKHAVDLQMERMFVNMPIVPRSEMDELYKTIYELKKRIRTMEKEMNSKPAVKAEAKIVETKASEPKATVTATKPAAKKVSK